MHEVEYIYIISSCIRLHTVNNQLFKIKLGIYYLYYIQLYPLYSHRAINTLQIISASLLVSLQNVNYIITQL